MKARIVYSAPLGGWYVVRSRHDAPLSGRFDTKAEAKAWLENRNRKPGPDDEHARQRDMFGWRRFVRLKAAYLAAGHRRRLLLQMGTYATGVAADAMTPATKRMRKRKRITPPVAANTTPFKAR